MKPFERLVKTVQRRTYDFLLTKYGLFLMCISMTIVFISLIQLSDSFLEYRTVQLKRFTDIINFRNSELQERNSDLLMSHQIDVVYTWVNGSDPDHIRELYKYKLKHNQVLNKNSTRKVSFDEYLEKRRQTDLDESEASAMWICHHKLCMQTNNLVVIEPKLTKDAKSSFLKQAELQLDSTFLSSLSIKG